METPMKPRRRRSQGRWDGTVGPCQTLGGKTCDGADPSFQTSLHEHSRRVSIQVPNTANAFLMAASYS